jgi:hypothetical protein
MFFKLVFLAVGVFNANAHVDDYESILRDRNPSGVFLLPSDPSGHLKLMEIIGDHGVREKELSSTKARPGQVRELEYPHEPLNEAILSNPGATQRGFGGLLFSESGAEFREKKEQLAVVSSCLETLPNYFWFLWEQSGGT